MSAASERAEKRRDARRRLAALRAELRDAHAERKRALVLAREQCRAERIAVKERTRTLRMQVLRYLRELTQSERATARRACAERLRGARNLPGRAAQRYATERAEQAHDRELRRIARAEKTRTKAAPAEACLSCTHETDDQVRANLTSDLVPLFERVAPSIKGGPNQTRTEAFLRYAETHPDEVLAASGHAADACVEALETEHRELRKKLGQKLNPYEEKKAARLARMRARADRIRVEASAAETSARAIADRIPFGQPILVGHHSEKRHRRDLDRIHRGFGKAHELAKEAEAVDRRADRAERSGAVSSDDPDAIEKLRDKLASVERDRARMVQANRAVRSRDPKRALAELGFSDSLVEKALTPDPMGHIGFPPYALKNAAAEAARLRERIRLLEERKNRPAPETLFGLGVRIEESDNRVRVIFDAKPDEATRAELKRAGFRWSPTVGAWQRHASNAAWYEAKRIARIEASSSAAPAEHLAQVIPIRPALASTPVPAEKRVKGEGLDTVGIAKRIREDIALDVREGRLPRASYSVRTEKYSMGSSIHVEASGFDFPVLNPDAFHVVGKWVEFDRQRFTGRFTEEAQYVERMLNQIVDAYHWDKSDSMTDYYNERFARDVRITTKKGEWEAIERQKLAEAGLGDRS